MTSYRLVEAIPAKCFFAILQGFGALGLLLSEIWSLESTVLSIKAAKPLPEYSLSTLNDASSLSWRYTDNDLPRRD